jgi:hypothetical protein
MTKRERLDNDWTRAHALRFGINPTDYDQLRRDAMRLRAWFARECGDGFGRCIERDAETGVAYETYELPIGRNTHGRGRRRIADLETPARARIASTCERLDLWHYIQTDPRGGSLYVNDVPLDDSTYNRGLLIW